MSTTIDQQVVEMRFDNKHFERNVATSMSTIEKLKQRLNLTGASKGLENVSAAAKRVDLSPMAQGAETVGLKFNAMYTIADQALRNITNSAMAAGKRIVSALTIDPVKTGFSEYETKMGSIQTIMANTEHQGTTMDDVLAALEELNLYADKTIYNFQEMTRNIGTFTAAGVDLETSVASIKGIANLAAVSGSTSQQASTAMYQLSQALATGTVRLTDWNSVVNAGMGGKVFQNALIRTAAMLNGSANDVEAWQKKNIDAYGSFRDSLSQGAWLTTEVLTKTLEQFTMAAEEGSEEWNSFKKSLMEQGYTDAQAEEILKMANTATDAATKVKTFTQLFDTLKESAQSGWAQTWELIFGDFEEAKEFFTGLSKMLGGLIETMSEYRNNLLGGVLDSNWDKLISKITKAGHTSTEYEEAIRKVWKAHDKSEEELDKLIEEYGSLEKAVKKGKIGTEILKEAVRELTGTGAGVAGWVAGLEKIKSVLRFGSTGDEVKALQEALEGLGHSVGKFGIDGIIGPDTTAAIKEFQKAAGIAVDGIAGPETLAALKKAGAETKKMAENTDEAAQSYDELIDHITEKGGRELFLEGFGNIINGIVGTLRALGKAWTYIFPPADAQRTIEAALKAFNNFTQSLRLFETELDENDQEVIVFNENGKKLIRIFKGVFAVVDIVATVMGGALRIAFEVVSSILGYFNLDILDLLANIADVIVGFNTWLESLFDISGILDIIVPLVDKAVKAVKNWFKAFKASDGMKETIEYIKQITSGIREWWAGMKDAEDLPKYIADGIVTFFSNIPKILSKIFSNLWKAVTSGFGGFEDSPIAGFLSKVTSGLKLAGQVIVELGKILLGKVNEFLSARGFKTISEDSIAGLVNGFKDGASKVWDAAVEIVKGLLQKVKDVLGIHSPSTEFFDIAWNCILGIWNGFKEGTKFILDSVWGIFTNILTFLRTVDLGSLIAGVVAAGFAGATWKLADGIQGLGNMFDGIGEMLEGVKVMCKDVGKGVKHFLNSQALINLATAIAILAGVMVVIALIGPEKMWGAVLVIAALATIVGVLGAVIGKFGTEDSMDLAKYSLGLLGLAAAIMVVAIAVKMLGGMDWEQLGKAGAVVGGFLLLILGLKLIGKIRDSDLDAAMITIVKVSGALVLLSFVAKIISDLSPEQLKKSGIAMGVAMLALLGFIFILNLFTPLKGNLEKAQAVMLGIGAALLAIAVAAKILGTMKPEELEQAFITMIKVMGALLVFTIVLGLVGSFMPRGVEETFLQLGGAILIMAIAMKVLASIDSDDMQKSVMGLIGIVVAIGILIAAFAIFKPSEITKVGGTLLMVSIAVAILAGVAILLGFVDPIKMAIGVTAVVVLSLFVMGLVAVTSKAQQCKSTIIALTVMVAVFAGVVIILSFIDPTKLIAPLAAVVVLGVIMIALINATKDAGKSIGSLIVMTVVMALLGAILIYLSHMPVMNVLGSAVALTILLLSLSVVMKQLGGIGSVSVSAIVAVSILTVVIIGLAFALTLLKDMNPAATIGYAVALTTLLLGLSAALVVLGVVGFMAAEAIMGMGALLVLIMLITGVLLALGGIAGWAKPVLESAVEIAGLMGLAIGAFVGGIVQGISEGVAASLMVIGDALAYFMDAIAPFIDGLADIGQDHLAGAAILASIVLMFAAAELINGISAFLPGSLITLGFELSAFMKAAEYFIATASLITPEMMSGVKMLAEVILLLTAAELIQGLASFLGGGASLEDFGNQLPYLGQGIRGFLDAVGSLGESEISTINAAASAVKTLASAAAEIPNTGGLLADLIGDNTLGAFSNDFPLLGSGIRGFLDAIGTFSETEIATVNAAADAVKTLASAASEIPNTGGLLSDLVGDNGLGTFASAFPQLGSGLSGFLNTVGDFDESKGPIITAAAEAVKTLASASKEIPNSGGLLAQLVGDNGLGTFAAQFPLLGTGLAGFIEKIKDIDPAMWSNVTVAAAAVAALAAVAQSIPNSGGIWQKIVGDKDLGDFGAKLGQLGAGVKSFADNLGSFTATKAATVQAGVEALKVMTTLGNNSVSTAVTNIPLLAEAMPALGTAVGTFVNNMPSGESINTAIASMKELRTAIIEVGGLKQDADGLRVSLRELAEDGIDKFIDAFGKAYVKISLEDAIKALFDIITNAIDDSLTKLYDGGEDCVDEFVDGIDDNKKDARSAGSDLGAGLVKGIKSKETSVYWAGYALGQQAVQGEKDGQASNSPSKLTMQSGRWLGEGLIIGMENMFGKVYDTGHEMGEKATGVISNTVSKIADAINTDIDSQPTIRPVLDLSDVRAGAGAIDGMLSSRSSISMLANVGGISSMMNRRIQNGGNSEVVSAIDKLSKKMDSMGNYTYNTIEGVTYNDDAQLAGAMQTIISATRRGRRS